MNAKMPPSITMEEENKVEVTEAVERSRSPEIESLDPVDI
jgi:hypothetical protein